MCSSDLFFSSKGKAYRLKGYEVPEFGRTSKGINLVNLLPLEQGEEIQAVLSINDMDESGFLMFATSQGIVKKTSLSAFSNIRKNGIIAIVLKDDDSLLNVKYTEGTANLMLVTKLGYAIKFNESDVREMGRSTTGVKGITLRENDECVSFDIAVDDEYILVVSENGLGKRTKTQEYKVQKRGGKGLITYNVNDRTGNVVGARSCSEEDELMLINSDGVAIRINVDEVSITSRNTMGVKLMRASDETKVVSIAKILYEEDILDKSLDSAKEEDLEEDLNNIEKSITDEIEDNEIE